MKSEQQFVIMLAVPVRRVGRTSVTVGAGLDTGIGRQPTARFLSRHGIYPFFLAAFFFEFSQTRTQTAAADLLKMFFFLFAHCRMHDLRALWCEKRIQMLKRGKRSFLFA